MANQFLIKNTMADMRTLSAAEITALTNGTYNGVRLLGYYQSGDTPDPIIYRISTTSAVDDGGSVIDVNGVRLEHIFQGMVNLKYFGLTTTIIDNTNIVNRCIQAVERYKAEGYIVPYTLDPIMINAHTAPDGNQRLRGIIQKSNMIVQFEPGARFKVLPSLSASYCLWSFHQVENVKVINPWVIGEREEHISPLGNLYTQRISNTSYLQNHLLIIQSTGFRVVKEGVTANSTLNNIPKFTIGDVFTDGTLELEVIEINLGQWGHCIELYESKNIDFYNLHAEKSWGDGLYLGCTVDNVDRSSHNNNINLFGKSVFKNCRRQGVSVISCDNFYAQYLYGEDIIGQNPQAVIDFEPNFSYHSIYNAIVENITAVRCKHAALFASQANRWSINVKNIIDIDNIYIGAIQFDGMSHNFVQGENLNNNINIGTYYTTKCSKAPIRISNWYGNAQGGINIDKLVVGDWSPDADGEFSIIKFSYTLADIPLPVENIVINDFRFNNLKPLNNAVFRPFFMNIGSSFVLNNHNVLKNIFIEYKDFEYNENLKEDGVSLIPVYNKTVEALCKKNATSFHQKASASTLLKSGDYKYSNTANCTLNIIRRGFTSAIIVNSYLSEDNALYTLALNPNSGFTTIQPDGLSINNNQFSVRKGAVVQLERLNDFTLKVSLLYPGSLTPEGLSAIIGVPDTNLLDVVSSSENKLRIIQYDSARNGLTNYPERGRGHIYVTEDPSNGSKCFIAIGMIGGTYPYFAVGKASYSDSTVIWHPVALQTLLATPSLGGVVKQSISVPNSLVEDSVKISISDASDLGTSLLLVNDIKIKFNQAVDLINELKMKLNAKLIADRDSGQQAS